MKKVLVIGSGGAGKSTFARRLGEIAGLEVIHLDQIHWQPGWVEMPKAEWRATVAELVRRDAWVMDGNYSGTLAERLAACDTIIFLDLPRLVCIWRVVKRRVTHPARVRPDMAPGCPERLNLAFLRWIWDYPRRTRPKIVAQLAAHEHTKRVVWLRTPAAVERFLAEVRRERGGRQAAGEP